MAALGTYFDGLYHGDTARLRQVFHPCARYYTATDGALVHLDMAQYFPIVAARPAPARSGQPRRDAVVTVRFAGPVTAFAEVHCAVAPRQFIDFLTLVRLDGRWQIVAKVFHHAPFDPAAPSAPDGP